MTICINSRQKSHDDIIKKIKDELKDFVSNAKDWALVPRSTIRPDDQVLVWVPFTSNQTSSIVLTAFILYFNGLESFKIIDDSKEMSVAREQYIGEDSYRGLRCCVTIVIDGNEFNIDEFYEF